MKTLWQQRLRSNFTSVKALAQFLELDPCDLLAHSHFTLNLPLRLAEKIEKGRLDDPILRQFVPLPDEEIDADGFTPNPVGDLEARAAPKLLHKYAARVLALPTSACAMHCRYCFRREFPYEKERSMLHEELSYIRDDPSLSEVILSGGDPLSLPDHTLKEIIEAIEKVDHIKRLRFHSRFVIGIPERITPAFLEILASSRLQSWFIVHCNHPRELDGDVACALKQIARLGIPLLNQSVLLKGINDDIETLTKLCQRLVDCGIQPYYLHRLDKVKGASHFDVSAEKGIALIEELKDRVSGYAVPRFVEEIASEPSKREITSARVS